MRKKSEPLKAGPALSLMVVAVAASSVAVISTTHATNFFSSQDSPGISGTDSGVWLTNNANYVVQRRNLTTKFDDGVTFAVGEMDNITGFSASSSSTSSCSGARDVCAYDYDYGSIGFFGWNECRGTKSGSHPNQLCSLQWAHFNLNSSDQASNGYMAACHELAHSVGLQHTTAASSCLSNLSSTLSYHDIDHIEDEY